MTNTLKHNNVITKAEGKTFRSKKEYRVWNELKLMEQYGEISDLHFQVRFELLPKDDLYDRPLYYYADYTYKDKQGNLVVADAKGMITEIYKIKKRLMWTQHGIIIKEL